MKRLLVVADDLGLTPGVNAGIAAAFREGILTSASLLANTAHFTDTIALVRELPGLKVGIHLSLVGGRPVLPASRVPSLAPGGERFRESWRRFLAAWLPGRIRQEEVRAEWRAQIARASEAGIRPSHLDSHQHLHIAPALWRITLDLAREFGIPRVRIPREPGLPPAAMPPPATPPTRRLVRAALARFSPSPPPGSTVRHCDHFFGILETGHLDLPALLAVLRRIPEGWSELITHPGLPDPELLRDYPWGYSWEAEARALVSEEARQEIARLGITLDRP
jgi:hopanoid biosynthesis associated protein HpnK